MCLWKNTVVNGTPCMTKTKTKLYSKNPISWLAFICYFRSDIFWFEGCLNCNRVLIPNVLWLSLSMAGLGDFFLWVKNGARVLFGQKFFFYSSIKCVSSSFQPRASILIALDMKLLFSYVIAYINDSGICSKIPL